MPEPGPIGPICLECAAIFGHLPLTIRCRLGDYTRAMMIRRILTICATVTAGAACASSAQAQSGYPAQSYPVTPGATYSSPYSPGAPADYRRAPGTPDFDSLQDEDEQQGSTALSPPGPVMSPDDPRYGRPMGAPVYSDRNAPTGPVMSPDDPRYGRPMGAPPVYSDRGAPNGPVMSPDDPRYGRPAGTPSVIYSDRGGNRPPADDGLRPPDVVGGQGQTGSVPQVG